MYSLCTQVQREYRSPVGIAFTFVLIHFLLFILFIFTWQAPPHCPYHTGILVGIAFTGSRATRSFLWVNIVIIIIIIIIIIIYYNFSIIIII